MATLLLLCPSITTLTSDLLAVSEKDIRKRRHQKRQHGQQKRRPLIPQAIIHRIPKQRKARREHASRETVRGQRARGVSGIGVDEEGEDAHVDEEHAGAENRTADYGHDPVHGGVGGPAEPEETDGYERGANDGGGEAEFGLCAADFAGCLFALADEAEEIFVETGQNWVSMELWALWFEGEKHLHRITRDCDDHTDCHTEEGQSGLPEIEAVVVREDEVEGSKEEIYYA